MTTVLSRGARVRRGGRRPGWLLLTALLVLAIGASSALVFTNRVELLKLAVILALWAAVVAAFVSVIYRRQSDVDQARARDLKLVYDLQLDREISARREYELTVESQLRRELASELRSQAADEVSALRAELAALRTNLEILFDTDLEHRPALETDRATVRAYSDWDQETAGAAANPVSSSRIAAMQVEAEYAAGRTDQNPIIDVPEVPAGFGADGYQPAEAYGPAARYERPDRGRAPDNGWPSQQRREPYPAQPPRPQPPQPEPAAAEPVTPARGWQPVGNEGQWLPPGAPGSNWVAASDGPEANAVPPVTGQPGRHAGAPEPAPPSAPPPSAPPPGPTPETEPAWRYGGEGRRARSRHSVDSEVAAPGPEPAPPPQTPPAPPPRHRSADPESDADGPATGGQSVADLLARLQTGQPTGGGRRRRREE